MFIHGWEGTWEIYGADFLLVSSAGVPSRNCCKAETLVEEMESLAAHDLDKSPIGIWELTVITSILITEQ